MLIVNVYAPNGSKENFFLDLQKKLQEEAYEHIMVMGDFNGIVDKNMDKQTQSKCQKTRGRLPQIFFELVDQEKLLDVWRGENPTMKDFTFFSNRHKVFTRIDMIWTTANIVAKTKKVEIIPKIKSDHNPIIWTGLKERKDFRWRINEDLFLNKEYVTYIKEKTKQFFLQNRKDETKLQTRWEAYKATIRGHLIALNSLEKKKKKQKIEELQQDLQKKEDELKKNSKKKKILVEIKALRQQIDNIISGEIYWNLKKMQQKQFEFANKPGKYLANLLKKKRTKRWINVIRREEKGGEETTDIKEIKRTFKVFYIRLYQRKEINSESIKRYLDKFNFEKPSEEVIHLLNAPIKKEETEKAITDLKADKPPGPDGFSSKFFKVLKEELVEHLIELMNETISSEEPPPTWQEATITLLPKENADLKSPKNYRPISLLNTDYKLFAKILAERLKGFLQKFIKEDQAGVLPGRQIRDNLRILLNSIEFYDKKPDRKVALFFLDAEEAIDNVNWGFMNLLIHKLQLGENFERAIKAIYYKQTASIVINNELTSKKIRAKAVHSHHCCS